MPARKLRSQAVILGTLLSTALILRGGMLWMHSGHLVEDRDAYLAIAQSLANGHGYSDPATRQPTAYRPPFYALVLAPVISLAGPETGVALLHLVLGTATVFLTLLLGRRLGLQGAAVFAALLVAVDPLLLQYTTFPMTETVFTFLATLLLTLSIGEKSSEEIADSSNLSRTGHRFRNSHGRGIAVGFVFGMCALCRPTIWAFGLLTALWWCWHVARTAKSSTQQKGVRSNFPESPRTGKARFAPIGPVPFMLVGVAAIVLPWLVRNVVVMGHPVLTTTHGGYTLLLGNNPVFYREVVRKPWGTVWSDAGHESTQAVWHQALLEQMRDELSFEATEVDRDRWMYRRAWQSIKNEPRLFVAACWLRFRRFWHFAPLGQAAEPIPVAARRAVALFYILVTIGLFLGLAKLKRTDWFRWTPIVLLLASFTLVHLFYWANVRMRAPLIPAIALLAAFGYGGWMRKKHRVEDGDALPQATD